MKNTIQERSKEISFYLKNFSNDKKLLILCYIWKDKKNVTEICNNTLVSQSQVSQILAKMKLEKIVWYEKVWKESYYFISDKKALEIIKSLKNIFCK